MGYANKDLIKACEAAKRNGNTAEWERLVAEVDRTQQECPHPECREAVATSDSPLASKNRLVTKGDQIRWCKRCSKLLGVNGADPWTNRS